MRSTLALLVGLLLLAFAVYSCRSTDQSAPRSRPPVRSPIPTSG
jgi:hypothetical protein